MEEISSKHFEIQRYFLEYFSRNKTSPCGWYNNDTLVHNPVRNQRMEWWISTRFPLQVDMSCLPYIDKGKPVGSRFGQMVRKIQDRYISCRNRFYHMYRSVPLPKNNRESLKQVSKIVFNLWYTSGTRISAWNNRSTFSDVPLHPEMFRWNDSFTFQPNFPDLLVNSEQPW